MNRNKKIVIAIDGPAGAGKSTIAKKVAVEMAYAYLDTGAMYRAMTLKAITLGLDLHDEESVSGLAANTEIRLAGGQVFLDGVDVTAQLRSNVVENNVSIVSRYRDIRAFMMIQQRELCLGKGIVADGRDIGTQVYPEAELKVYLTATPQIRIKRRYLQNISTGNEKSLEEVKNDIFSRDNIDSSRTIGPLKPAEDSVYLDTSNLTIKEVVQKIVQWARVIIQGEGH